MILIWYLGSVDVVRGCFLVYGKGVGEKVYGGQRVSVSSVKIWWRFRVSTLVQCSLVYGRDVRFPSAPQQEAGAAISSSLAGPSLLSRQGMFIHIWYCVLSGWYATHSFNAAKLFILPRCSKTDLCYTCVMHCIYSEFAVNWQLQLQLYSDIHVSHITTWQEFVWRVLTIGQGKGWFSVPWLSIAWCCRDGWPEMQ